MGQFGGEPEHGPLALLGHPHVLPAEAGGPDLLESLLGCEARGQPGHKIYATLQLGNFVGVEHAAHETLGVALHGAPYASQFHEVEPYCNYHGRHSRVCSLTPSALATNARCATPRNSPWSTTPG